MRTHAALVLAAGVAALAAGALPAATPQAKLTVTVSGQGRVASAPKGIACPKACSKSFARGRKVKLTPAPAAGWRLARWTGACAKAKGACTLAMTGPRRAGAVFEALPPPGFTPQTLAGTWSGSWRNETFGSTGPASIILTVVGATAFTFQASLGGNVFGCSSPPPATGTVNRGTGPNTWDDGGFNVDISTPIGGRVTLAYAHPSGALTGTGVSGCNPAITWRMSSGTFAGNTFSGRIEISLSGTPLATSVLTLARG